MAPPYNFESFMLPSRGKREGKKVSIEQAIQAIPDNSRVFIAPSCGAPVGFLQALTERADQFQSLELVSGYLIDPLPTFAVMDGPFRYLTLHPTGAMREAMDAGKVQIVPSRYSDYTRLLAPNGPLPPDVVIVQVSPPGPEGLYSLGVSVGSTIDVVRSAPLVIAQINPQMPYVFGAGELRPDEIDVFTELEAPLVELPPAKADEVSLKIAEFAANEVADGSTVQFGIGALPEAILNNLQARRNLRLHGGMVSEACMGLAKAGALVDGISIYAAEVFGTRKLFDWMHRNPIVHLAPGSYSHGIPKLATLENFVALNSAIEIALDGTVNAETVGHRVLSGPGGSPDFAIGASLAPGGKLILALPSTAARGKQSRIVKEIHPGVTTLSRYLVDRIITEFGVAELKGATLPERAERLMAITHPDFRATLSS